jgi:hypothetical protein
MGQRSDRARLLLEAATAVRIGGKPGRQDLDGDEAPEARVARLG